MGRILGIDLGTTNSVMAFIEGGDPVIIPNAEGDRVTPSVVAISKSGERLIGQVARRQAITNPEHTVFSVKRFMGRKLTDATVQADRELIPYKLSAAPNGDVRVIMDGREYAPPEISAMILQKLRADAEAYLGEPVTQAVITVPAYFNDSQRQATRDAGRIAGLEVLRIINEPTASALAYGLDRSHDNQVIAVYDLGGGTFDISVLDLGEGVVEVKATSGDTHLGGDDFDQRIIEWMLGEFQKETGIDLRSDRMAMQRLKEAAEKAKIELSSVLRSEINLPFITADATGPRHLSMVLSRAKLEQLTADLIERTIKPVRQALSDAELTPEQITTVILVGGQTRMPAVQAVVQKFFGREPSKHVNPDEVVAQGAAVQAAILSGGVKDMVLLDVTPLTLGIRTLGGIMTPLIERNTTIPTRKSQVFSTAADNQQSVEIHVLQGERVESKYNKSLGIFELSGIPPAPRGVPKIEVTFDIDANGIMNVSARDQLSGAVQEITITASSGLAPSEIEQMVADAEEHREADELRRDLIAAQNTADSVIYSAERALYEAREYLMDAGVRETAEAKLAAVREVLDHEDAVLIRNRTAELQVAMQQVYAATRVAQAASEQAETPEPPDPAATSSDAGADPEQPRA